MKARAIKQWLRLDPHCRSYVGASIEPQASNPEKPYVGLALHDDTDTAEIGLAIHSAADLVEARFALNRITETVDWLRQQLDQVEQPRGDGAGERHEIEYQKIQDVEIALAQEEYA